MPSISGAYQAQHGPVVSIGVAQVNTITQASAATLAQYPALIDSGATGTCISPKIAKDLALKPIGKQRISGATGTAPANVYIVDIVIPMAGKSAFYMKGLKVVEVRLELLGHRPRDAREGVAAEAVVLIEEVILDLAFVGDERVGLQVGLPMLEPLLSVGLEADAIAVEPAGLLALEDLAQLPLGAGLRLHLGDAPAPAAEKVDVVELPLPSDFRDLRHLST